MRPLRVRFTIRGMMIAVLLISVVFAIQAHRARLRRIAATQAARVASIKNEIASAKSDLKRAEDRVVWASHMFEKKYVSKAQLISEKLALQRATFAYEQAKTKLNVLVKYTKDKTIQ
jgi:CRISPR/Cas system type I-B associated protein Csh2 (Cas7 group RAMP superfamily)